MIVVTGAAGFIGSYLVGKLNREGFKDIILVDKFDCRSKSANYQTKSYSGTVDRDDFFEWLSANEDFVQIIIHLGARTDTVGSDPEIFKNLNLDYSKNIWNLCVRYGIPMIYASSAATYGNGEHGFNDDEQLLHKLQPMNLYAQSKHDFDCWALSQEEKPYFWAGLKFFNVFGPNEYHKQRMASVVLHAYNTILTTGRMSLFKSHHPKITDGCQARDFIYVEDIAKVILFLMRHRKDSGIYNIGTGTARTYLDLTKAVFKAMNMPEMIDFIDTPKDLRDKYQYYTCANMLKLKEIGYNEPFYSLENAIDEYVSNFLMQSKYY